MIIHTITVLFYCQRISHRFNATADSLILCKWINGDMVLWHIHLISLSWFTTPHPQHTWCSSPAYIYITIGDCDHPAHHFWLTESCDRPMLPPMKPQSSGWYNQNLGFAGILCRLSPCPHSHGLVDFAHPWMFSRGKQLVFTPVVVLIVWNRC